MNTLVQPDPGLYIWTIVTFLVLVAAAGEVCLAAAARGAGASAGRDPQVARRCAEGEAGTGTPARRIAADPGYRACRGGPDPVGHAVGCESVPRGAEAEGAVRGRRHREERRASDRAGNGSSASADPHGGRRYIGGDRVQVACAQRVERGQRAAHRRDVQADRSQTTKLASRATIAPLGQAGPAMGRPGNASAHPI